MKRAFITAAVGIALLLVAVPAAQAAPVHLGCYVGPKHPVATVKPTTCGFYKDSANYAKPVGYRVLRQLRWTHWGRRDARGTGVVEGKRRRVWASMPDGMDRDTQAYGMLVIPGLSVWDRPILEMALPYGFDLWPLY